MRATRLMWMVLMSGAGAGCAATASHTTDGLRPEASLVQSTPEERREMRDSAFAQAVADEVGPRVSVTADFDNSAGSRRVDARFHMYDDAYVIVGHLDASGRLKVVFPSEPGDDGFVRGEKIYQVPSFFAGFDDEYAWNYSRYRYQTRNVTARRDSYDAGLAYVFVIASWRPMRLDRITDGNRWLSYEITDVSYMNDPREAIEELGSLIAGDNREAYTIEYARYSTTNFGTYSYSSFDALYNSDCYGYSRGYGYRSILLNPFMFLPSYGLGFASLGCSGGYSRYGYYGYPIAYTPTAMAPPVIPRGRPTVPIGSPVFHGPANPGNGGIAVHRPRPDGSQPTPGTAGSAAVNSGTQYRRPGLIAEDAPSAGPRGRGRASGSETGFASRPTIQQMIGSRRIDQEARDAGARGTPTRDGGFRESGSSSWSNSGGSRAARESARTNGGESRTYSSPRSEGSHAAPARSEPRSESPRSAPAHSEPARAPAPSSSSAGSKKP